MSRRNPLLPVAAFVVLILFSYAVIRLLMLRYERGDIYPAYSTLRADPLGARIFYEALGVTDNFQVERGFVSLHRALAAKPDAIFYLGLTANELASFSKTEVATLNDYVRNGGRVVITLPPEMPSESAKKETPASNQPNKSEIKKDDKSSTPPSSEASDNTQPTEPQTQQEKHERDEFQKEQDSESESEKRGQFPAKYERSLAALWGFGWDQVSSNDDEQKTARKSDTPPDRQVSESSDVFALRATTGGPEYKVPWKSALYFVRLEPDWEIIYYAKDKPVLIQRHWGKGEVLVATDSYFISNEALRNDRRPILLSFIAGLSGHLLFDEVHLGTQEQEGVMVLAQRFRLEGYLCGMIFVAALFLWRNSIPLVPPRVASAHTSLGGAVSGKDSRSGLVNLLRRNIAMPELLKICLTEWKRGITPKRRHLYPKIVQMESVLAASDTTQTDQIVPTYQQLREINAPSRIKGSYATKS